MAHLQQPQRIQIHLGAAIFSVSVAGITACGGSAPHHEPIPEGYYELVAPILAKNCVGCHSAGGIAPFSLDTYEAVAERAGKMKHVTQTRIMPPFLADNTGACNTYKDAMWLTDMEIATIGRWFDDGKLPGDPKRAPELPTPPERALPSVSASIDIGVDYTPNAALDDDYRCFVVDPAFATDRFLTGVQVRPGATAIVHHVIVYAPQNASAEAQAVRLDSREAGPGYTCFGGPRISGLPVAGWAPGMPATRYPDGTGIRLAQGRKLIIQVHYNTKAGVTPDRTRFDMQLADSVDKEAYMIPAGDYEMVLAPGQASVSTTVQTPAPLGFTLHGIIPHMHRLGRKLRVERVRAGVTACVIDVPRWDFDWQLFYFYSQPIRMESGDVLRLTCTFDTSSRTEPVRWGEGTEDEMCFTSAYVTL
ncbi:MAG: monooxygenase [Deltaproteobacteria bacterium]|nr:monooxygenase [Deltaproteobacteria bacterium]